MAVSSIRVIDNRGLTLRDYLSAQLASATSLYMASAFVKRSGLRHLLPALERILDSEGVAEVVFGLDFRISDPAAIVDLLELSESHPEFGYYAFSDPKLDDVPTFHPKLYLLEKGQVEYVAIVGSSNVTQGGLAENEEVNLAVEGARPDDVFEGLLATYRRYKAARTLFSPNQSYIEAYAEAFRRVRSAGQHALREERTAHLLEDLRTRETRLAEQLHTQKGLIVEALRVLPKDAEGYAHLNEISTYVEQRARALGLEFKWDTLWNSIRGRLNEHTVGKGGEGLFERKGGVEGREGKYRLSPRSLAEKWQGAAWVPILEEREVRRS